MFWRILPHATACVASNKLFVLDLRRDRYFRVPQSAHAEMLTWLNVRHGAPAPDAIIDLLGKARVLQRSDPVPTNALRDRVRIPDTLVQAREAPARGSAVAVARQVAAAWLRLRCSPLHLILSRRRMRTPLPVLGQLDAALVEAAAFERSRPLVPIARNCLLDSLALDSWLARRGYGAQLVFGITPEPFAAHCWLQIPQALLNDSYDHVSSFTPILAL